MPVLTSAPLVGAAGRPVSGRVVIEVTEPFVGVGEYVTTARQGGVIRDGLFFGMVGNEPLELVATPDGVGCRITLHLSEQGAPRGVAIVSRTVVVPSGATVDWASLEDFVSVPPGPVVPGAGFGLTPFGSGPFGG